MGKWYRADAAHPLHPKFVQAGHWGGSITRATWRIAKMFDRDDGDITPWWGPAFLIPYANMGDLPDCMELAAQGMAKALEAGLVVEAGGSYYVHGWEEHQPVSSTARVKAHRARKGKPAHNETVTPVSGGVSRNVTKQARNGETTHGTVPTGRDQRDGTGNKCPGLDPVFSKLAAQHVEHEQRRGRQPVSTVAKWIAKWAEYYAEGMADDQPNGPPWGNVSAQGYADRVSRCMEHAYSGNSRTWRDDDREMPMADAVSSPGKLRKMLAHIERDMDQGGQAIDEERPSTAAELAYMEKLKADCERMKAEKAAEETS